MQLKLRLMYKQEGNLNLRFKNESHPAEGDIFIAVSQEDFDTFEVDKTYDLSIEEGTEAEESDESVEDEGIVPAKHKKSKHSKAKTMGTEDFPGA